MTGTVLNFGGAEKRLADYKFVVEYVFVLAVVSKAQV